MNVYISEECRKDIYSFVYDQWGDKDYEATVRRDWEKNDDARTERTELKCKILKKSLLEQGLLTPNKIDSLIFFLNITERIELGENPYSLLSKYQDGEKIQAGLVNKSKISDVLKNFPKEDINNVCDVFWKHLHLNEFWVENTYAANKLKLAVDIKKDLNKTIKGLGGHISRCRESEYCPMIVLKPLQEALTLAIAYRDFLDLELKKARHKTDGTQYAHLTSRAEWTNIISDLYIIFAGRILHQTNRTKLQHGDDKDIQDLIAQLLAVTYPWCWGENHISMGKASKNVKDRLYPK